MPTSNERKALWFFAVVALSGGVVRLMGAPDARDAGAPDAALARQLARVDSARNRRSEPSQRATRGRPAAGRAVVPARLAPGERIDLDRATAAEIDRLPGIGPALAGRIVAHRDSAGAFGHLEALCEVRGIGQATIERLRPLVAFSGVRARTSRCSKR